MLDPDGHHGDDDGQEAVREDAEGGRGELPVGCRRGGPELRRHDELLHVAPRQVRRLQAAEAEGELEGLGPEVGFAGGGSRGGGEGGGAHGDLGFCGTAGVDHQGLHLAGEGRWGWGGGRG